MNQTNTQSNTIANENSPELGFLKELGIEDINAGACSGSGAWSDTAGRDLLDGSAQRIRVADVGGRQRVCL